MSDQLEPLSAGFIFNFNMKNKRNCESIGKRLLILRLVEIAGLHCVTRDSEKNTDVFENQAYQLFVTAGKPVSEYRNG